jgi:hypothetical protein
MTHLAYMHVIGWYFEENGTWWIRGCPGRMGTCGEMTNNK